MKYHLKYDLVKVKYFLCVKKVFSKAFFIKTRNKCFFSIQLTNFLIQKRIFLNLMLKCSQIPLTTIHFLIIYQGYDREEKGNKGEMCSTYVLTFNKRRQWARGIYQNVKDRFSIIKKIISFNQWTSWFLCTSKDTL